MSDGVAAAVSAAAVLLGVILGGVQQNRAQHGAWKREEDSRLRAERRAVYVRFITAARAWRAHILGPHSQIKEATARDMVYADGGPAFEETLRALTEIRLISLSARTVDAADRYNEAVRELASVRASVFPGPVPHEVVAACGSAESDFLEAARGELATPRVSG